MRRSAISLAAMCFLAAGPTLAQQANTAQAPIPAAPSHEVLAAAQQRLQQLGYQTTPTGRFDASTRNAAELFQSEHGLRPTGQIDLSTLAALGVPVTTGTQAAMLYPAPGEQSAMLPDSYEQQAEAHFKNAPAYNFPLLNEGRTSSSPQIQDQPNEVEILGVPQKVTVSRTGRIPGLPPGYPTEDLVR
ncbi:MAG: peptidoglycan-binding domain-containing protein [Magnetospirillum sp.]|nr:peptidoglycan-binding domain-containing protein [Magnetospirillum sp.]